jgi:hypothetical protein
VQTLGRDLYIVAKNPHCLQPTFKAIIQNNDELYHGTIKLSVKPKKFYIFDKKSEQRIYLEEGEPESSLPPESNDAPVAKKK